jgi:hypothetical protein
MLKKHRTRLISGQIITLVLVGFLAFDLLPGALDANLHTSINFNCLFFTIAAVVFINVHHFFIDSTIWKMDQKQVRDGLFGNSHPTR